ncbi:aspartyl-phosphate phosphatase Spo0E family protein [Fictibacillus nanhaiensis]
MLRRKTFTHPIVLEKSQELDVLIHKLQVKSSKSRISKIRNAYKKMHESG